MYSNSHASYVHIFMPPMALMLTHVESVLRLISNVVAAAVDDFRALLPIHARMHKHAS
jgi:hypothetical protein